MKTTRHVFLLILSSWISPILLHAAPEAARAWTDSATGRQLNGTLLKKNDNGTVVVKKDGGGEVSLSTASLSPADQDYVRDWKGTGLVLPRERMVSTGQGGAGGHIDEIGAIFAPYGTAEDDRAPHPEAVIYEGPSAEGAGGGSCKITYLMKRDDALKALAGRGGAAMKQVANAPGLPSGLTLYKHDIKLDIYGHMTLVVDDADQVVCLQFKSDRFVRRIVPDKVVRNIALTKSNYLEPKDGKAGVLVDIHGSKGGKVLVNMATPEYKETVTWHVPAPLVKVILFNVQEKQKRRN